MSLWTKNLIESEYPEAGDLMFEPMLIHSSTPEKLAEACDSGEYFGQIKIDGGLYMFTKTEHYNYLFARTKSKLHGLLTEKGDNVPHIMSALSVFPKNTVILGEIFYPGKKSKDVTTIMGCLPAKAIERQNGEYGKIHYYIYDILFYEGEDLRDKGNWDRYKLIQRLYKYYNLDKYDFLHLAESWTNRLQDRIHEALAQGEEGMVLKKKDGIYAPGKRPVYNLKAKQSDTLDAFIIKLEKAKKDYVGKAPETWEYWSVHTDPLKTGNLQWVNVKGNFYEKSLERPYMYEPITKAYYNHWNTTIVIGAYDEDGNVITIGKIHSGISDAMCEDMTNNPDNYLNKVVEIKCMEKDKKGHTLRHGFFVKLREDKNKEDCKIQDIFS